jgi:hypothetical protein
VKFITLVRVSMQIVPAGQAGYSQEALQKNDMGLSDVYGRLLIGMFALCSKRLGKSITNMAPNF